MISGHDLVDLAGATLGWTLAHSLWQTTALALAYAAWRTLAPRASVSLRYAAALLSLGLGVVAAVGTCWSLSATRGSSHAPPLVVGRREALGIAVPVPTTGSAPLVAPLLRGFAVTDGLRGLVVLWTGGVLFLVVRLFGGLLLAGQIRKRAAPLDRPDLHEAQSRLAKRLGLGRAVPLLQSDEVAVPVALGWRRPAVLFPTALARAGTAPALEPLLAHELAHVHAQDYAANVVQTVLDALLFVSPGAHWLSAEVRSLREYRCDDRAVAALGGAPALYVRALARLAEAPQPQFPAPAATGPRLVNRIRRLTEGEAMPRSRTKRTLALAALVVATTLVGSSLFSASRRDVAQKAMARPAGAATPWTCPALLPLGPGLTVRFPGNEIAPRDVAGRYLSQDVVGRYLYCDPHLLDGKPVDWATFNAKTRGTLTLVHGDPSSPEATRLGFSVSLRRDGKILDEPRAALLNRVVTEADLEEIFKHARSGDQLIIDPVDQNDWRARKIIDLGGC